MTQEDIDTLLRQRGVVPTETTRLAERISIAANCALEYGDIDGGHHKQWVITQMLRALLEDHEQYLTHADWDEGIAP